MNPLTLIAILAIQASQGGTGAQAPTFGPPNAQSSEPLIFRVSTTFNEKSIVGLYYFQPKAGGVTLINLNNYQPLYGTQTGSSYTIPLQVRGPSGPTYQYFNFSQSWVKDQASPIQFTFNDVSIRAVMMKSLFKCGNHSPAHYASDKKSREALERQYKCAGWIFVASADEGEFQPMFRSR